MKANECVELINLDKTFSFYLSLVACLDVEISVLIRSFSYPYGSLSYLPEQLLSYEKKLCILKGFLAQYQIYICA
jgi:hypothetical protein